MYSSKGLVIAFIQSDHFALFVAYVCTPTKLLSDLFVVNTVGEDVAQHLEEEQRRDDKFYDIL